MDSLGIMKKLFLLFTRGFKDVSGLVQAGISSSLLSIELVSSRTQINNVTVISVGCNCGLLLRKCNTLKTTNIVLRLTA
jgi:hypothetical protein